MKVVFQTALLVLFLLLVALVSALTTMRLAIHGHEVAVPKLVGLTPADAERAASAAGLHLAMEREYYSPQVPEGRIMSQLPEAGVHVRRGWRVRVAESLGPQRVIIPDVVGSSQRAAELNIRRRGLDVGTIAEIALPSTPADQVISQSPPANATDVSTPKISLLVNTASEPQAFVMPNFTGQSLGGVSQILQDAGMRLGAVTVAAQPVTDSTTTPSGAPPAQTVQASPASIIVTQNPAPGQRIIAGSAVSFEVKP
jgi:eukaryotic-like serine/threonine-protein kinase